MRGKEVHIPEQQGVVDKGLGAWKKFNKITLAAGVGAGTAGVVLGLPGLAVLGFTSAAIDAGQNVVIHKVQEKRKNRTLLPKAAQEGESIWLIQKDKVFAKE